MIQILPLGGGQGKFILFYSELRKLIYFVSTDVGRSCIIVTIGGRTIMFDCGMHMGYNDERRFPDFTALSTSQNFDRVVDLVIISHLYH
jgi:Cft2 family RNA processing exonuclease